MATAICDIGFCSAQAGCHIQTEESVLYAEREENADNGGNHHGASVKVLWRRSWHEEVQMNLARWIIGFVGVLGVGGLLADYVIWGTARQHMKNPAWPPHAKFHNAQTILLGLGLGILTVILAYRPTSFSFPRLIEASCAASLYWLSMLFAPLFPGTAWVDPEFRNSTPRPIGMHPQQLLAIGIMILVFVALGLGVFEA